MYYKILQNILLYRMSCKIDKKLLNENKILTDFIILWLNPNKCYL